MRPDQTQRKEVQLSFLNKKIHSCIQIHILTRENTILLLGSKTNKTLTNQNEYQTIHESRH